MRHGIYARSASRLCGALLAATIIFTNTLVVNADTVPSGAAAVPAAQALNGTIVLDAAQASTPADGESLVALSGRVLDSAGNLAQNDVDVMLTTTLGAFIGSDDSNAPGFHVTAKEGMFQAVLQAPATSGTATISAYAGKLQAMTTVHFTTALRHGISAGSFDLHIGATRSDYYAPLESFLSDDTSGYNVQTTAFAQGPIAAGSGDQAQLTVAIDNQNPINGDCSGLTPIYGSTHEQTSCTPRYSIYGDESTQTHLANSSDNVYFRFEKNADFVTWGDYDTSEFSSLGQTYAATTRELHGAKAGYTMGKLSFTGLYAVDVQAFQRDIIAPNGTSGTYYLSRQIVVPGSEIISLELEPVDRPGDVVSETVLTGGVDYELDPETGSLTFTQPVEQTSTDPVTGALLVQHIIATYQYDGGTGADAVGTRLQYALPGTAQQPSGIGFSSFMENMGAASFALNSGDIAFSQGKIGHFMAEVANSASVAADGTPTSGAAYHAEEQLSGTNVQARAYLRHADSGFSNDAASQSFVAGQTQYGASIADKVSKHTTLSLQADEERDLGTSPLVLTDPAQLLNPGSAPQPGDSVDSDLNTASVNVIQKIGRATATVGVQSESYTNNLQPSLNSNNMQSITRIAMPFGRRWSALGEADETLSGTSTELYPAREALGVAYQVADGVELGATTQALHGGTFGDRHFTSLDASVDRHLDDATQLTAKYALYGGADGFTAQQEVGLNHQLPVGKHLRADLGFENATGSLFNLTGAGLEFAQPYAVGSSTAGLGLTGGTDYHAGLELVGDPVFKAGGRFEHSSSVYGTENVIRLTAAGDINAADKLLFSFDRSAAANQLLGAMPASSDFAIGFAMRDPSSDSHNWLASYEFRQNPGLLPTQLLTSGQNQQQNQLMTSGNVVTEDGTLAVEGIESVTSRLELYGKIASRHSQTEISPGVFSSSTLAFLQARARYDIGRRYDVTIEGRQILQDISDFHETGYVGELGYLLTPELRGAVGYEGGWVDQMAFDQGQAHQGAYLDLTMRVQNLWRH